MQESTPKPGPENKVELSEKAKGFINLFQSWKKEESRERKQQLLQEWYKQFLAIIEGQTKFIERESIRSVDEVVSGRVIGRAYLIVASGSSGARIDFEQGRYLIYRKPNASDSYAMPYYENYMRVFGSEMVDLLQDTKNA